MLEVGYIAYIESGLWIASYKKLVENNPKAAFINVFTCVE